MEKLADISVLENLQTEANERMNLTPMSVFNAGGRLGEDLLEAHATMRGISQQFAKSKNEAMAKRCMDIAMEIKRIDDETDRVPLS